MKNNPSKPDPRYCLYYYFGLIAFSSGLFCLTILPSIAHFKFVYPEDNFFIIPGVFLLILSLLSWQLTRNTTLYQSIIIGCGLIFFSLYQIMIKTSFSITSNISTLILCLFIGLALIFSSYDIFNKTMRKTFNLNLLIVSSIASISLVIIIIMKHFGYA